MKNNEVSDLKNKGFAVEGRDWIKDRLGEPKALSNDFSALINKLLSTFGFKMDDSTVSIIQLDKKGLFTFGMQDNEGKQVYGMIDVLGERLVYTHQPQNLKNLR